MAKASKKMAAGKNKTPPKLEEKRFDPDKLNRSIISIPLLQDMAKKGEAGVHNVIIDINLDYLGGRDAAKQEFKNRFALTVEKAARGRQRDQNLLKLYDHPQYIFARLQTAVIRTLVEVDNELALSTSSVESKENVLTEEMKKKAVANEKFHRTIYKLWPDFPVQPLVVSSIKTVKADAAKISFSAAGNGIVWAVVDSGIDQKHPHFSSIGTLVTPHSKDFTKHDDEGDPFSDPFGHGTHVAGIIAGEQKTGIAIARRRTNEHDQRSYSVHTYDSISGLASQCKLVSLKVLNDQGEGIASQTILAINHIQQINGYGRDIKIHGVNISIGHRFEPEWFACGQSPLCVEVNRLVKSGVVVVVAAGNSGYGFLRNEDNADIPAGISLSINDPGNAEGAITVGSTHRDMPHIYGVSYFSSKGPTGDGRLKPDLIAPGERIASCATGTKKLQLLAEVGEDFDYCEDSGTSMAAPHVSGVIAAFLSIRQEFIGQPERIKEIFTATATDLKRDKYFQGHGLVDLMRAIQSV